MILAIFVILMLGVFVGTFFKEQTEKQRKSFCGVGLFLAVSENSCNSVSVDFLTLLQENTCSYIITITTHFVNPGPCWIFHFRDFDLLDRCRNSWSYRAIEM